jgi:predicted deacylase
VATVRLEIGRRPVWVAAQEIVGLKEIGEWMDRKCRLPFVNSSIIGQSLDGHPLRMLAVGQNTKSNCVFVIGRQHPPEVTGSLGLMSFVDTLTGNTRLARRFRSEFQTLVIPLVNPDGLEHGHWRNNLGGVDLNRDWGPFSQPESSAVSKALLNFAQSPGARPFVFVDFHSTRTNAFYTQPDGPEVFPRDFTRNWLAALHRRLPEFGFIREDDHNAGKFTAKAWANDSFGIASITWEFGYGTDRKLIRRAATVGAEEFLRQLLTEVSAAGTPPGSR